MLAATGHSRQLCDSSIGKAGPHGACHCTIIKHPSLPAVSPLPHFFSRLFSLLNAAGVPAAAAGALQVTATSAALAAAAAAGGGAAAAAAGGGEPASDELWVDRYVPRGVSELVVHKKKVAEVVDWLQFYLQHRATHHTRALLVTGEHSRLCDRGLKHCWRGVGWG